MMFAFCEVWVLTLHSFKTPIIAKLIIIVVIFIVRGACYLPDGNHARIFSVLWFSSFVIGIAFFSSCSWVFKWVNLPGWSGRSVWVVNRIVLCVWRRRVSLMSFITWLEVMLGVWGILRRIVLIQWLGVVEIGLIIQIFSWQIVGEIESIGLVSSEGSYFLWYIPILRWVCWLVLIISGILRVCSCSCRGWL